ncbi:MAG: Sir2 family NAD-dependent protein deacetylase [bacterium]|nr:MAG: Sir2 family NAD-dependent protein deacetylase [bacterium]
MNDTIEHLATLVREAVNITVLTGAGISTESGISDFRSPGGVWDRYNPDDLNFQSFLSSEESRKIYWKFHREFYLPMKLSKPNDAHYALAELEQMGKLQCVITQNVDNLHQRAGSSPDKVIKIHGTACMVRCLACGATFDREEIERRIDEGEEVPRCESCNGLLKPATVSFGQPMPEEETSRAFEMARSSDLFVVLGSSLVVYPAAQLPFEAINSGAKLAIINLTATPYDNYADVVIHAKCGETMKRMIELVKGDT